MIKLLIVDDEDLMDKIAKPFFERQGYNVFYAGRGNEGIEIFKRESPDVVLLDLGLPDMSGRDVLVKLKEINKQTKVAILTGFGEAEIKKDIQLLGADAFFTKPCRFPLVVEQIKKWYNT